jgi:hypothetical protein
MSSRSLQEWQTSAAAAFDELEAAHRAVGGVGPGRRVLTQQLNYAYVTLLAARFQGYVRALHTQTADVIASGAGSIDYEVLLRESLTLNRALNRQNAQPDSIAKDFNRFGFDVWAEVERLRSGNRERRIKLQRLIEWRNAIAHYDIDERLAAGTLDPLRIKLSVCKGWRRMLGVLATSLDHVAADQCEALGRSRPW